MVSINIVNYILDNYLKAAGVLCTDDKNTSCDIKLT
jgi:hypothetical protein